MGSKTVLVIDDDAHLVRALTGNLEKLGLTALGAQGFAEAAAAIAKHQPQMVIIDLKLPDGDGVELCRKLAGMATGTQPSVIVMTGKADNQSIRECFALGAQVLVKTGDLWKQMKPMICKQMNLPLAA